jgi:hypothetical protein
VAAAEEEEVSLFGFLAFAERRRGVVEWGSWLIIAAVLL